MKHTFRLSKAREWQFLFTVMLESAQPFPAEKKRKKKKKKRNFMFPKPELCYNISTGIAGGRVVPALSSHIR